LTFKPCFDVIIGLTGNTFSPSLYKVFRTDHRPKLDTNTIDLLGRKTM
jgi:hypothetical protein